MENNDIKLRKKPIRKGKKPTLVRSPVSNRWIKVGGATWRKLVAQNIIGSGNWVNPNEILSVDPEDFENKNTAPHRDADTYTMKSLILKPL